MTFLISWLLTGVLLGQPGYGAGPRAGDARGGRQVGPPADITPFMDRVAEAVNATPDQVEQLRLIAAEHQAAALAVREARRNPARADGEQLRALREQMREARREGDNQKVRELHEQIRAYRGGPRGDLMHETHAKITAILTAEQKAAFEAFLAKDRPALRERAGRPGPARSLAGSGPNIYRFIERVGETVEATQEQRQQLQAIADEHVRAVKAAEADHQIAVESNREQIQTLRGRMRDARRAGNIEQVEALRAQLDALESTSMIDIRKATREKIEAVLTAEQRAKLDTLIGEYPANRGDRGRHGRDIRGGEAKKHQRDRERAGEKRGRHGMPPPPPAERDGT